MVASYSPLRPPTERDTLHLIDGAPNYLGCLASTGAVVDNGSTTNKFNYLQQGNALTGTLAGKVLMFQADVAGYLLPSALSLGTVGVVTLVAQANTVIGGSASACGPSVLAAERVLIIMQPTTGWIQWLPSSGSGNCYVWELL